MGQPGLYCRNPGFSVGECWVLHGICADVHPSAIGGEDVADEEQGPMTEPWGTPCVTAEKEEGWHPVGVGWSGCCGCPVN